MAENNQDSPHGEDEDDDDDDGEELRNSPLLVCLEELSNQFRGHELVLVRCDLWYEGNQDVN